MKCNPPLEFFPRAFLAGGLVLTGLSVSGQTVITLEPYVAVAPNVQASERVVSRETVEAAKPIDLAEILSNQMPAAALSRRSPLAGDIVLRGLSRDNVVITVDDTKTYCACPNRMDPPAFHVSSQQIEAVRVRTGPFSVDQGGAIGGSVFVQTAEPEYAPTLRAYGYVGSFDYYAAGIAGGAPLMEDNLFSLAGFYYQEGGVYEDGSGTRFTEFAGTNYLPQYVDDRAYRVVSADVKVAYDLENGGNVNVGFGYQDATDVLYPGLRMDALSDTMVRGSVGLRMPFETSSWADGWQAALAFSTVDHDMRDSFRTSSQTNMLSISRGYMMRTEAETAFYGLRVGAYQNSDDTQIRYGIDLKRRLWDANNVVGPNVNDMIPDVTSDSVGFWAVYEKAFDGWAFEGGLRLEWASSEADDSLAFVHGLRGTDTNRRDDVIPALYFLASRELTEGVSVYGGVGYAARQPDPQERYLSLDRPMANPDWIGNPDLDPVQALELQAGAGWVVGDVELAGNVFHSWLLDYIYLEQFPAASATSYTNIDARLYGVSVESTWNATDFLRFEAGLAWQRGEKTSRPGLATNDVLAEVPPLRGRLAADLNFERWSLGANVQLQDRLDRIDTDLNERELDGWAALNLTFAFRATDYITVAGGVDNLTDETYAVANAFVRDPFSSGVVVNEPGRFWYLRIGAEF